MQIALDAMGGDHGPQELIAGAILAADQFDTDICLVGDEQLLKKHLESISPQQNSVSRLKIVHAATSVGMDENPVDAIRKKKDSSIMVAFDLVKNGEASAVVSAGNSGATLAAGVRKLGRLKNVARPGLASIFPTMKGPVVVMDVGANVECRPVHLYQFAVMASAFSKLYDVDRPRVGLLTIGEESGKGNSLVKETYELLEQSDLNFIGNVEGRDVFQGDVDVIVCDGFVGNICLKISEGLAEALMKMLKDEIVKSNFAKLGYLLAKPAFDKFRKRVDYAEYGGAPLLGIKGTGIICHGKSNAQAIKNAISVAIEMEKLGINDFISRTLKRGISNRAEAI
ncbi:MAG: phosphate acyltransferase PlsX [Desulfobulbaceae bacterium]|nr:MAG: phosphate acyltransferase PlsX [Desulfobulbaceae bacterium]